MFFGEMSVQLKGHPAKIPYGEMSLRQSVFTAKCPYGKMSRVEMPHDEMSYDEKSSNPIGQPTEILYTPHATAVHTSVQLAEFICNCSHPPANASNFSYTSSHVNAQPQLKYTIYTYIHMRLYLLKM